MMLRRHLAAAILTACLFSVSTAADTIAELVLIDGQSLTGKWLPAAEPGRVALHVDGQDRLLREDDLISARFPDAFKTPMLEGWEVTVWSNDGSIFPADINVDQANRVVLKTPFTDRAIVQIDDIAAIRWNRNGIGTAADMRRFRALRKASKDILVAAHKDGLRVLEGTLETLSAAGGSFNFRGRVLEFHSGNAFALILAGNARAVPSPAVCVISDEYRIAGRLLDTTVDTVSLLALSGLRIVLPLPTIRQIIFHSARVKYLGDLKPAGVRQASVLGTEWPMRTDRSVSNQPMSMASRPFARGIGVHADSEITYRIDSAYVSLAATIGIDDRARPAGHVIFRVIGDNTELFSSGPITGRDEPLDILVDVGGVEELKLVVEHAEQLDIGDHANWANARLIKP